MSREMQAGSTRQGGDRGCKYTVALKVAQGWHHFEKIVGLIAQTMTILLVIKAAEMNVIKKMLPLLAGNLPRMIQYYEESEWTPLLFCKVRARDTSSRVRLGLHPPLLNAIIDRLL